VGLLAVTVGITLGLGAIFWIASRLGRQLGETDVQLEAANAANRKLREAVEADERVRRDIAAAGVYQPDENQRD
jgi:hypothetical protein